MKTKFYICRHCGNQIQIVKNAGVPVMCCGEKMHELVPNTTEAAGEKHLPVVTLDGGKVTVNVGAVNHPMLEEHFIEWVYVETENGGIRRELKPGSEPIVSISLDEKPTAVYAYCNLHGLWAVEL